eukprot:scaffold67017_cov36-Tisochrysis_lutea.AAC.1
MKSSPSHFYRPPVFLPFLRALFSLRSAIIHHLFLQPELCSLSLCPSASSSNISTLGPFPLSWRGVSSFCSPPLPSLSLCSLYGGRPRRRFETASRALLGETAAIALSVRLSRERKNRTLPPSWAVSP